MISQSIRVLLSEPPIDTRLFVVTAVLTGGSDNNRFCEVGREVAQGNFLATRL